ncbi:hypothetical protein LCGC14_2520920 [marine sediment metagenome]|uniref:Uncharacterized protein n=1 Tax=marine sediment metagenome TaxID=412755 RepID=A0A0F9AWD3_9ZZZZ
MSHTFKTGNTIFHYNSDFSGHIKITTIKCGPNRTALYPEIKIPLEDLLEFFKKTKIIRQEE